MSDTQTEPKFKPGDRFFTHYDMQWGWVVNIGITNRDQRHGVTGSKLPDTTWYNVEYDNGHRSYLDDAHGDWDMARMLPPHIAKRFGYGEDPNPPSLKPTETVDPDSEIEIGPKDGFPCDYCRGFTLTRTDCPRCGPAGSHRIEPVNALAKVKRTS
jgi:hypothetical protein